MIGLGGIMSAKACCYSVCGKSWCSLVTAISIAQMRHVVVGGQRLEMGRCAQCSCGLSIGLHVVMVF